MRTQIQFTICSQIYERAFRINGGLIRMSFFTFFIILYCHCSSYCQKLKQISKSDTWFKETYSVLKSDKKIRQGSFKQFDLDNHLLVKGFFNQDIKDSIWEYYDSDNKLMLRYDYGHDKLIEALDIMDKAKMFKVVNGTDTVLVKLEVPPNFIGGNVSYLRIISANMIFPSMAKINHIEGRVFVGFFIDTNGIASNYSIIQGIGGGCDEAALNAVKKIPNNWIPGILDGHFIKTRMVLPVSFQVKQ